MRKAYKNSTLPGEGFTRSLTETQLAQNGLTMLLQCSGSFRTLTKHPITLRKYFVLVWGAVQQLLSVDFKKRKGFTAEESHS